MHIDWWTLVIQAANVLILVWLLAHFFWLPLRKIIDQRKELSAKLLADAQAALASADAEKLANINTRAGFAAERDSLLKAARAQIESEREAARKLLAAETERRHAQGLETVERERKAIEQALAARAAIVAVDIAQRLLAKTPSFSSISKFTVLTEKLRNLPVHSRDQFVAAAREGNLTVISAAPLDAPAEEACCNSLGAALGVTAKPAFAIDPALLCGFSLRSDALMLNDNWRDDLAHIMDDLKRDER